MKEQITEMNENTDNLKIQENTKEKATEAWRTRKEISEKLKEEFDVVHKRIVDERNHGSAEDFEKLIQCQRELSTLIIREARALGGDNVFSLPPYAFDTV